MYVLQVPETKIPEFANNVDLNEVAHNKPHHLDQYCLPLVARPCSAVGRAPDLKARGSGFDTQSGHILSFLLPLQDWQLSVTDESMCTKYWLTASEV